MEPIAVRFFLTRAYIVTFTWISALVPIIIITLVAIFGTFIALKTPPDGSPLDLGSVLPGIAFIAFGWIGIPLVGLWSTRGLRGDPVDMVFSDEGIRADGLGRHGLGEWSTVTGASIRGPFLLVKMRAGGTTGIPTAAFASPAQVDGLLETIRAHVKSNKALAAAKA